MPDAPVSGEVAHHAGGCGQHRNRDEGEGAECQQQTGKDRGELAEEECLVKFHLIELRVIFEDRRIAFDGMSEACATAPERH